MKKLNLITSCLLLITSFYGCEKNEIDYTVSRNDVFTITMTSNISTGYSWYWAHEGRTGIVDSLKHEYTDSAESGIGKEGQEIWTFAGKKKGKEKLVFVYKRADDVLYENKKEFFVKVK